MAPRIPGLTDLVVVGQGGFGVVYRAIDERFGRVVAVKVISGTDISESVLARFERECRAVGALSGHPNIVAVHSNGTTDSGELYLVMEYLPGGTSLARMRTATLRSPEWGAEVLGWAVALSGALETAHRVGIIHRDVKPGNILLSSFNTPKLVDFGIARMHNAFQTQTGAITATINHAAPEVISGEVASASADIYSLCSVLHQLYSGQPPFFIAGETSLAPLIARVVSAEPPTLTSAGVPTPVSDVILRGMAKEPKDRYASAAALGEALRAAGRSVGVALPPVPIASADSIELAVRAVNTPVSREGRPSTGSGPVVAVDPTVGMPLDPARVATVNPQSVTDPNQTRPNSPNATQGLTSQLPEQATGWEPGTRGIGGSGGVGVGGGVGGSGGGGGTGAAAGTQPSSTARLAGIPADSSPQPARASHRGRWVAAALALVLAGGGGWWILRRDDGPAPFNSGETQETVLPSDPPPGPDDPQLQVSNQLNDERDTPFVGIEGSSRSDGGNLKYTVSGLPPGLILDGRFMRGTIPVTASSATTDMRQGIKSSNYVVTVTATDEKKRSTTAHFLWTIRDTYTVMPDYVGKCAENTCGGPPTIEQLAVPTWECAYDPQGNGSTVWAQSEKPGSEVKWGGYITFWKGKNDDSCSRRNRG